jgi:hypothetical protein
MVWNPTMFLEVASNNWVEFQLWFATVRFNIDFMGYRVDPITFAFTWNLDLLDQACYAISWSTDGLDIVIDLEMDVYECEWGLFGGIYNTELQT